MKKIKIVSIILITILTMLIPIKANATFSAGAGDKIHNPSASTSSSESKSSGTSFSAGAGDHIYNPSESKGSGTSTSGSTSTSSSSSIIDPIENPNAYKPGSNTENTKLVEKGKIIISTIQIIGVVASVLALIVIGFRYMFGSVEDKANYKELLIPYIIGVVMLFSIITIVQVLYNFVTGLG